MAFEPVSIVIPSWNGAAILRPTLAHLAQLEGAEFEVLVVDHGRLNRDTEALLKEVTDPRFRYLGLDAQLGFAGAVNYGSDRAAHALVAVICNDVLVERDWLLELLRAYAEKSAGGRHPVVTSLVTRPGFETALSSRYNIWGRIVDTGVGVSAEAYVPFFPDGSSFLFDKSFYGAPFDGDYFLYQEDVSLGWRAWLMGESVCLAPLSRALNADGGTTRRTPHLTAYFSERNRWLNYCCFLSLWSLFRLLPALGLDGDIKLLAGSNQWAKLKAWGWICLHPLLIWRKRKKIQSHRRRGDAEIFQLLTGKYMAGEGMLNKMFRAYFALVGIKFDA